MLSIHVCMSPYMLENYQTSTVGQLHEHYIVVPTHMYMNMLYSTVKMQGITNACLRSHATGFVIKRDAFVGRRMHSWVEANAFVIRGICVCFRVQMRAVERANAFVMRVHYTLHLNGTVHVHVQKMLRHCRTYIP